MTPQVQKKVLILQKKITMASWAGMGSGFDFGASAFNIGLQELHNRRARKWQEDQTSLQWARNLEARDTQYERDIEQRDYANWYNSPQNQMNRFKEAGLNPHLIYGKGTPGLQQNNPRSSAPTAGKADKFGSMPELKGMNPLVAMSMYQDIKKKKRETDLVSATIHSQNLKNSLASGILENQIEYEKVRLQKEKENAKTAAEKAIISAKLNLITDQELRIKTKQADIWETGANPNEPGYQRAGWEVFDYIRKDFRFPIWGEGAKPGKIEWNEEPGGAGGSW